MNPEWTSETASQRGRRKLINRADRRAYAETFLRDAGRRNFDLSTTPMYNIHSERRNISEVQIRDFAPVLKIGGSSNFKNKQTNMGTCPTEN